MKLLGWKTAPLRSGHAIRVIFYYSGEEPTYLDDAHVVMHKSGIVDIFHREEQVSTHIQNIEIIWSSRRESTKSFRLIKSELSQSH